MTEHYPKAPITEAIIALHFSSAPSIKSLEKFADKQRKSFPKLETLHTITTKIDVKTAKQDASIVVSGFKLTNADTGLVLQVSHSQFGVSKLAPYGKWDELFDNAHHAWTVFKTVVGHVGLSRLSTRFINRIDIPNKNSERILVNDYFSLGIVLPKVVSDMGLLQFGISCRLDDPKNRLLNIINVSSVEPPLLDHSSFSVDIDVVTTDDIPTKEELIWDRINGLRTSKNSVFEAIITDATRALFK